MNRFGRTPIAQNIFDAFRAGAGGGTPPAAKAGDPPASDAFAPGAAPGAPDAAAVAERERQAALDAQNKSPLAEFSKLWEDTPPAEGEQPPINWDDPNSIVPAMNIDPKKLADASKRIDYSKLINPEKAKLALSGDIGAFTEILNTVQQAAFANSSMATARFVEAALKRMAPNLISEALPHAVRKHSVRETVAGENPIFKDPAVAPLLEMFEERLRSKFPTASAAEISTHAKKYLTGFAAAINAPAAEAALRKGQPKPGDLAGTAKDDWTGFFDVATSAGQ